jgi:hypothetical protein
MPSSPFCRWLALLTAARSTAGFDIESSVAQQASAGSFRLVNFTNSTTAVSFAKIVGGVAPTYHELSVAVDGTVAYQASDGLSAGSYVVASPNSTEVCSRVVELHAGYAVTAVLGRTRFSVAGRQLLRLHVSGIIASSAVLVRVSDGMQTIDVATSEVRTQRSVRRHQHGRFPPRGTPPASRTWRRLSPSRWTGAPHFRIAWRSHTPTRFL